MSEAQQPARLRQQLAEERAKAEELARRLEERDAQLADAMTQLARLDRTDALTGLLNRGPFADLADEAIKIARRHGRNAAILLCDVDRLKTVNEQCGYPTADALVRAVAQALSAGLRSSDVIARVGGGEFAILLAETSLDGVSEAAERCCRSIAQLQLAELAGSEVEAATISAGAAVFPQDGDSVDELLSRAAAALQRAKDKERGSVAHYDAGMEQRGAAAVQPGAQFAGALQGAAPTVLLVDADAERARSCADQLAPRLKIICEDRAERALGYLGYRTFDAVVAGQDAGEEQGQDLLRKVLSREPQALRVLLVGDEEEFLRALPTNSARAHRFIVRDQYPTELASAVLDALNRRQVSGTSLFAAVEPPPSVGGVQAEALEQILAEEALDFVFQPIVRATHRQVIGFEALCRPRHPLLSTPVELFEIALQLGVLWELGRLVRRKLARRLRALPADALVFVNTHPAEIADHELLEGESCLRPFARQIVFEVPLRSALPSPVRFRQQVRVLREHGYGLALDDLGPGFGRLSSLALFEPRFLKLGGAITADIEHSETKQSILRYAVEAAAQAQVDLVCEKLETVGQVRAATLAGAHLLQGFALGEPAPI